MSLRSKILFFSNELTLPSRHTRHSFSPLTVASNITPSDVGRSVISTLSVIVRVLLLGWVLVVD